MRSFGLLVLLLGVALAVDELSGQEAAYRRCGPDEKFSRCGGNPKCQKTCAHPNTEPVHCVIKMCFRGCVCREGYVRLAEYGPCVLRSTCPPTIFRWNL